jgi:hypothetical protein
LKGGPFSVGKWLEFFRWIATHRAFRKYVCQMHGLPEGANPNKPPFVDLSLESSESTSAHPVEALSLVETLS